MRDQMKSIRETQEKFVEEYMLTSPWDEYVQSVGIPINAAERGMHWPCLLVGLKKSLPHDLRIQLPLVYQGLWIYTEPVEEVVPLAN